YIQTKNLMPTGIDYEKKPAWVDPHSHNDPQRSRLQVDDLLFGNAGVASIGRTVVVTKLPDPVNISQDIDLIRFEGISPHYVGVFLKCHFGRLQIERLSSGVGAPKITFAKIKSIKIPVIPENVQTHIEKKYREMAEVHDEAMRAKEALIARGVTNAVAEKDPIYREKIQQAEELLHQLVQRTIEVVEGKRKDVV
ncbi:MAG: hypothetical protein WBW48_08935, partial [Anaerolineae bacterium]